MLFELFALVMIIGALVVVWPYARRVFRRDDKNKHDYSNRR